MMISDETPLTHDASMSDGTASTAEPTDATPKPTAQPWVTRLAVVACIGIFLGITAQNDFESWESLAKFGYLPADSIWDGGYWALVTSAFVHLALWHVAFNVYWLRVLGSRLEEKIGSLKFLAFFVVAAMVSSSVQLAFSGDTGIGASGVVYAIFGFMWPTRYRYPRFNEVLDERTIQIFVVWLGFCVVATHLKIWNVGNAAHISGLLFGGAVAGAFVLPYKPRLMLAGLVTLVGLSIVPLFWCPWNVTWLSHQAYSAHAAEQYDAALERYNQIIRLDPENAWAHLNRSYVYEALGKLDEAQADLERAREIDPSIEKAE
ncbi:hypothetical protein C5Y96_23770 [Blastopirellula marina]|uniref:Peptidase S54 rhomboid domain-containing protein n=2 Tax=Pirellulales TaxID=2691354 RepID=A0A2S8EZM9_9BACT|nr:hypothetical protein C5Y96_23770 [Blastopirellula marina]RCS42327.1 rhomboid family intramembrane serine protease [Bremerella cremea]